MFRLQFTALFIAVILVAACVPELSQPLSTLGAQAIDKQLLGTWFQKSKSGEMGFLHIGLRGKRYEIHLVEFNNQRVDHQTYQAHNTKIGDNTYLNLKKDKEATGFIPIRYVIEENKLKISIANVKPFKNAIKEGALAGKIEPHVTVTSPVTATKKFIVDHDKEIFKEFKTYHRLKVSEPKTTEPPTQLPGR